VASFRVLQVRQKSTLDSSASVNGLWIAVSVVLALESGFRLVGGMHLLGLDEE
jgi:hypothetical protein